MTAEKHCINTARLTLGAIRECDFENLISIFKCEEVSRTYMVPDMKSEEEEHMLFSTIFNLSERSDRYVYGIFFGDKLIGIMNDTDISGTQIELGYALHPAYFSNGYMTEALSAMIDYLLRDSFDEVICGAFDHNIASVRVMQKCGMSKLDKTDEIDYRGKKHRCIYYSIKR